MSLRQVRGSLSLKLHFNYWKSIRGSNCVGNNLKCLGDSVLDNVVLLRLKGNQIRVLLALNTMQVYLGYH